MSGPLVLMTSLEDLFFPLFALSNFDVVLIDLSYYILCNYVFFLFHRNLYFYNEIKKASYMDCRGDG